MTFPKMAVLPHIAPQHLCRSFKNHTNKIFTEFVNHIRIEKIKDELEFTGRPLHLIYEEFNFTAKYLNSLIMKENVYSMSE